MVISHWKDAIGAMPPKSGSMRRAPRTSRILPPGRRRAIDWFAWNRLVNETPVAGVTLLELDAVPDPSGRCGPHGTYIEQALHKASDAVTPSPAQRTTPKCGLKSRIEPPRGASSRNWTTIAVTTALALVACASTSQASGSGSRRAARRPRRAPAPPAARISPPQTGAPPDRRTAVHQGRCQGKRDRRRKKLGGSIEYIGPNGGAEGAILQSVYKAFTDATGTDVKYTGSQDDNNIIQSRVQAGNPPDIADLSIGVARPMQHRAS